MLYTKRRSFGRPALCQTLTKIYLAHHVPEHDTLVWH